MSSSLLPKIAQALEQQVLHINKEMMKSLVESRKVLEPLTPQVVIEVKSAADTCKEDILQTLTQHMTCPICQEVVIEPCSLNCGHVYCCVCIDKWLSVTTFCPTCRHHVTSCRPMVRFDKCLKRIFQELGGKFMHQRNQTLKQQRHENTGTPKLISITKNVSNAIAPPEISFSENGFNTMSRMIEDSVVYVGACVADAGVRIMSAVHSVPTKADSIKTATFGWAHGVMKSAKPGLAAQLAKLTNPVSELISSGVNQSKLASQILSGKVKAASTKTGQALDETVTSVKLKVLRRHVACQDAVRSVQARVVGLLQIISEELRSLELMFLPAGLDKSNRVVLVFFVLVFLLVLLLVVVVLLLLMALSFGLFFIFFYWR